MPNKKIADGALIGVITDATMFEVSVGSSVFYRGTASQIRTNSDLGVVAGRTIHGGIGAYEDLVLDSTSNGNKGDIQIGSGTTLHANTTNYETLVTDNDDIPNKKYVDDAVLVESIWDRTGTDVTLQYAGDTVQLDATGGLQFGGSGQNIGEFSIDGTLTGDSDTAVPTEKAIKTYVDNHTANGVWSRTGTDVSLTNAGDTVQFDGTGGTQFGAAGQTITEYSIDGALTGDSDTALPTEKAVKTYVDDHTANGMWSRAGTLISVSTPGDTLDLRTSKGIYLSESGVLDIVAVTGIPNVDDELIHIRSSTAGDVTITANPQIVTPPDGAPKRVLFIGTDNTKTVTFVNGNGLATNNGQPFTLGLNDVIVFIYSSLNSIWIEESRSDNT